MEKVTMRHIAQAAGVSKMTVSRALRNHPYVSPEVRIRIGKLAREMGYRPHPYISALMSGLAQTRKSEAAVRLAVFHFDTLEHTLPHSYYRGVRERALALGYEVEPFLYDGTATTAARLRRILIARGIRGIILMPAPEGLTSIAFDFNGFASAALGHSIANPPLPRVASDIYSGTIDAFDELFRRGYTRIGMISTAYVNRLANFLYSAAVSAYHDHVHPEIHLVEYTLEEPARSETSSQKMKHWILSEKLEVVVCPNFDLPLYDILKTQGFAIPGRLSYLHLIDYPDPKIGRRVSQLDHLGKHMGAKAVDVVTSMINRNEFATPQYPQVVGIRSQWREGRTTPVIKHPK